MYANELDCLFINMQVKPSSCTLSIYVKAVVAFYDVYLYKAGKIKTNINIYHGVFGNTYFWKRSLGHVF